MTIAEKITAFLFNLRLPFTLPEGIEVLNAHSTAEAQNSCTGFYKRFYNDGYQRHLLLGINPGRFGGGVTGIPFTDPIRLFTACGIANPFQKKQELSSVFMYEMIEAFGGAENFYRHFYISSISPLGFTKAGKNLNYYDDVTLLKSLEPFAVDCINKQLAFNLATDVCFCIGEGKNIQYLQKLNATYKWFGSLKPLPHPRFIMQYKLKQKENYIQQYVDTLKIVT